MCYFCAVIVELGYKFDFECYDTCVLLKFIECYIICYSYSPLCVTFVVFYTCSQLHVCKKHNSCTTYDLDLDIGTFK